MAYYTREFAELAAAIPALFSTLGKMGFENSVRKQGRYERTMQNDQKELDPRHKTHGTAHRRAIFTKENSKLGFLLTGISPNPDDGFTLTLSIGYVTDCIQGKQVVTTVLPFAPVFSVPHTANGVDSLKKMKLSRVIVRAFWRSQLQIRKLSQVPVTTEEVLAAYASVNTYRQGMHNAKKLAKVPETLPANKAELLAALLYGNLGLGGGKGKTLEMIDKTRSIVQISEAIKRALAI